MTCLPPQQKPAAPTGKGVEERSDFRYAVTRGMVTPNRLTMRKGTKLQRMRRIVGLVKAARVSPGDGSGSSCDFSDMCNLHFLEHGLTLVRNMVKLGKETEGKVII